MAQLVWGGIFGGGLVLWWLREGYFLSSLSYVYRVRFCMLSIGFIVLASVVCAPLYVNMFDRARLPVSGVTLRYPIVCRPLLV